MIKNTKLTIKETVFICRKKQIFILIVINLMENHRQGVVFLNLVFKILKTKFQNVSQFLSP